MKFGKLQDISNVDFTLPAEPETNSKYINTNEGNTTLNVYIGCTGWSMPEWKGTYYPADAKVKDFGRHYADQFNTIEFNTTHYTIPKVDTVKRWYESTADDFMFCPKVFKFISHTKQLGMDGDNMTRMLDSLVHLNEKLGPFFIQLPPYFGKDRLELLESFYEYWPKGVPLAVELRHESWYTDNEDLDTLQELTASYGHTLLITDVAGRRDIVHMRLCGDTLLVRWVGNALHKTDYERIDEWVHRIKYYSGLGLKNVYFFTHEPDNILAPDIAGYLCQRLLSEIENVRVRGPQKYDTTSQLQLF